jgi:hypothetical protein
MPPDFAAGAAVLAILLALLALAVGLMHPSLLALAIALGVVAVLVSPSPP